VEVRGNPAWKVGEPAWNGWGASSDLFGSRADETENQVPNIPNLTETRHEAEVRGNPAWKVGEEDGITRTGPQGDRDRVEVVQMKARSGWGESSDTVGSMADETENQVPNIPNPNLTETIHEVEVRGNPPWKVGGPALNGWGWGASSELFGSMADKTENQVLISPTPT
jgi:hypothetical protein